MGDIPTIHNSINKKIMKTFTFSALFMLACLLVASALGQPDGSRPGQGGGATVEDDDMTTLFNSISGTNGILGADTFSQPSTAASGHNGLKKLEINLNIKVVLVKIGGGLYTASA